MAKSKRKRVPKTNLKLPDLEQSKSAVLNSLTNDGEFKAFVRPCHWRIYRLVRFGAEASLHQAVLTPIESHPNSTVRPVDEYPEIGGDTPTGV
jgi:hypothetical protein